MTISVPGVIVRVTCLGLEKKSIDSHLSRISHRHLPTEHGNKSAQLQHEELVAQAPFGIGHKLHIALSGEACKVVAKARETGLHHVVRDRPAIIVAFGSNIEPGL